MSCRTSCGAPKQGRRPGGEATKPTARFYGPPGTGKTTVVGDRDWHVPMPSLSEVSEALALMKQFFGKDWRSRVKAMQTPFRKDTVAAADP